MPRLQRWLTGTLEPAGLRTRGQGGAYPRRRQVMLAIVFAVGTLTLVGGFSVVSADPPPGSTLTRAEEPVVIQQSLPDDTGYATGPINVQLPARLLGIAPRDLVAFRWDGVWKQIPVQVDEREVMDLNRPYTNTRPSCSDPCYNNPPNGGAIHPEFSDDDTFVGADTDPTLDSNDEVALMAFDTGGQATSPYAPNGVDAASAVEVEISDPLDGGLGYAYLFEDTSGLDPAAGKDYVDYEFNLVNGPYETGAYNPTGTAPGAGMNLGPRPETSFVATANYRRGFTDRWWDNELRILRGAATGVDILDRHDDQFDSMDASCIRTQDTFRRGEGAFVANTDGPVRAIRDFVGANSGPHVQRQHIFYGGLEVINTFLRVHPIPGVIDFFDYSAAGVGLIYENGVMTPTGVVFGTPPGGVTIDGQPDAVTGTGTAQLPGFETVDGPQGGLSMPQRLLTNNPDPAYRLGYRDGNVNGQNLCNGDDEELYGASGPQLNSAVNNTDEAGRDFWGGGQFSNLFYQRSIYYEAPGDADGPRRLAEMQAPLDLALEGITLSEPPPPPTYDVPGRAASLSVSLVPSFRETISASQCGARGGTGATHEPPLAFPSCDPPAYLPGTEARLGSAARPSAVLAVVYGDGNPTNGNQADVAISAVIDDVHAPDGSDYDVGAGSDVALVPKLRLSDTYNGSSLDEPATASDFALPVGVSCVPTADPATGSSCELASSVNAVMPDAIRESESMVLQTFRIRVNDSGGNGVQGDADDRTFAQQGIYVP